jgi:hypothetical protein
LAGELSLKRFETTSSRIQVLVDKLARDYPLDHTVILYEAATNPFEKTRIEQIPLRDLPTTPMTTATTLVIPAAYALKRDESIIAQLNALPETQLPETEMA